MLLSEGALSLLSLQLLLLLLSSLLLLLSSLLLLLLFTVLGTLQTCDVEKRQHRPYLYQKATYSIVKIWT